MADTAVWSKNC